MDKEPTISLQRNILASIDLQMMEDEEMSETERKAYCSAIFAVFPRIEKDLKRFMYQQLLFQGTEADTWEKVIFGRGTFNGLDLMYEYYKKVSQEHISNSKREDDFDKHEVISKL